jgi:hypothetical protein
MISFIFILLGIIFISISLFLLILYLNLFTLGYNFLYFWEYIIRNYQLLLFIIGIILIYVGKERSCIHELLLRFKTKFLRK